MFPFWKKKKKKTLKYILKFYQNLPQFKDFHTSFLGNLQWIYLLSFLISLSSNYSIIHHTGHFIASIPNYLPHSLPDGKILTLKESTKMLQQVSLYLVRWTFLTNSSMWEPQKCSLSLTSLGTGRESSLEQCCAKALILGFPASRTVRNTFLGHKLPGLQ